MGAGISNRRSGDNYGDDSYKPRTRDQGGQTFKHKSHRRTDRELGLEQSVSRNNHIDLENLAKSQASKINIQKPLQSKIDQVFTGTISPENALKFVTSNSSSFTHVQLANMITRTSDFLQRLPVADKIKIGVKFLPLMDEIFTIFQRNRDNLSPRELSAFLRSLSSYAHTHDHARHYLVKNLTKPRILFDVYLGRLWQRSLDWSSPNLIDLCHAGIGMMANRSFFATKNLHREQGNAPYSEPVRRTFSEIAEKMDAITSPELSVIMQLIRESVSNKMVSISVLKRAEQLLLTKDETGRTKLDDILSDQENAIEHKIELAYKLSSFGIKRPDDIKEIEGFLKQRFEEQEPFPISTEAIAEFVCACFFHNHQIDHELLSKIENKAIEDLTASGLEQASSHKTAYFMGLGLLIQKGALSPQMEAIVSEAADNSDHRKSELERQVVALIRQSGWEVFEHQRVGPCIPDALVKIDENTVVNIEIDGFPYHYVYLIDDGKFCQTMRPASNRLRDAALERMGIPVLRLSGNDLDVDQETDSVANLKDKIESFVRDRYKSTR